jgi:predicted SAM-dependent methyltransferase
MATRIYVGQSPIRGWKHVQFNLDDKTLSIPCKKCTADEVMVDGVLEYLPINYLVTAINELRRPIAVGGKLIVIFPDVIKASLLYQRGTISFEDLQLALSGWKIALTRTKIENLLLMRFDRITEIFNHKNVKGKKLWFTILIAEKLKDA